MVLKSLAIVVALAGAGYVYHLRPWSVELPDYSSTRINQWANQGWSNDDRHWFHHAPQGTSTFGVPYEWFIALEQPEFLPFGKRLADQNYLARFGFIPSPVALDDKESAPRLGYTASTEASPRYPDSKNHWNRAALPVGFAAGGAWFDPISNKDLPIYGTGVKARSLGLTCAACHTGQLEFGKHRILIDGGAGMISLDKFRDALQISLKYTFFSSMLPAPAFLPTRFNRFAKRVLGEAAYQDAGNRDLFKAQFLELAARLKAQGQLEKAQTELPNAVKEGYARLDALNRIGNEVFQAQMDLPENIHPLSAPVSYPYIWNAPWFNWVQYNSSIMQPMVRNLGEAMGVKGKVNLVDNSAQTFDAPGIPIRNLHEMEVLLMGGNKHPLGAREFGGLRAPRWADLPLPPLDPAKVAQGRRLYMEKGSCVDCHLPPLDSPGKEIFADKYWQTPTAKLDKDAPAVKEFQALLKASGAKEQKFLALVTKPVVDIGTDCRAAYDMLYRTVSTPDFIGNSGTLLGWPAAKIPGLAGCESMTPAPARRNGYRLTNFGVALGEVVYKTKQHWYSTINATSQQRLDYDGDRPNGIRAAVPGNYPHDDPVVRELPAYKARPLNGVWATAPFLHNGSVPNLYLLLSPQAERNAAAATFWVGSREFDPNYVGYKYRDESGSRLVTTGLFQFDTRIAGNRNTGHLFTRDYPAASGSVWRELTPDERFSIIEFLKSL